jgi:hypothetical protein
MFSRRVVNLQRHLTWVLSGSNRNTNIAISGDIKDVLANLKCIHRYCRRRRPITNSRTGRRFSRRYCPRRRNAGRIGLCACRRNGRRRRRSICRCTSSRISRRIGSCIGRRVSSGNVEAGSRCIGSSISLRTGCGVCRRISRGMSNRVGRRVRNCIGRSMSICIRSRVCRSIR